jgi:hypothetical protein
MLVFSFVVFLLALLVKSERERETMNGKWSGNSFLLGSSSLALTMVVSSVGFYSTYLLTTDKQVIISRKVVKTALS